MIKRLRSSIAVCCVYLALTVLLGCRSESSSPCPIPDLIHKTLADVECQFFLGTTAYRNKDYQQAAQHWAWVIHRDAQDRHEGMIVAEAHGTLGYLRYHGLGAAKDAKGAVELFKKAVERGDLESRAHLGFAYSDKSNAFYDTITAYAWYKSVENFYRPGLNEQVSANVLKGSKNKVAELKKSLTTAELKKAEERSWVVR
jgi:hypothetical protein